MTSVANAGTGGHPARTRRKLGHWYRRGRTWWIKYYVNGRPKYESTHSEKESEARRLLQDRLGRIATGQIILPRADRIRYDEAAEDLTQHYQATGSRNLEEAGYRFERLREFFTGWRLAAIGPAEVMKYVLKRQGDRTGRSTGSWRSSTECSAWPMRTESSSGSRSFANSRRMAPGKGSLSASGTRRYVDISGRIFKWPWRSRIPLAGGCGVRY